MARNWQTCLVPHVKLRRVMRLLHGAAAQWTYDGNPMAHMQKICDLVERNSAVEERYRYLTGWIDATTKLVVMPNRSDAASGDWIAYIATYSQTDDSNINDEEAVGRSPSDFSTRESNEDS